MPVQCAGFFGGANVNVLKRLAGISIDKSASLISGLVGHLIVASTDGFVRIILVPAIDNRPHMPEEFKLCLPTKIIAENDYTPGNVFRFKPKTVLRLAPCTGMNRNVAIFESILPSCLHALQGVWCGVVAVTAVACRTGFLSSRPDCTGLNLGRRATLCRLDWGPQIANYPDGTPPNASSAHPG